MQSTKLSHTVIAPIPEMLITEVFLSSFSNENMI